MICVFTPCPCVSLTAHPSINNTIYYHQGDWLSVFLFWVQIEFSYDCCAIDISKLPLPAYLKQVVFGVMEHFPVSGSYCQFLGVSYIAIFGLQVIVPGRRSSGGRSIPFCCGSGGCSCFLLSRTPHFLPSLLTPKTHTLVYVYTFKIGIC